jgi:hypothetical protein
MAECLPFLCCPHDPQCYAAPVCAIVSAGNWSQTSSRPLSPIAMPEVWPPALAGPSPLIRAAVRAVENGAWRQQRDGYCVRRTKNVLCKNGLAAGGTAVARLIPFHRAQVKCQKSATLSVSISVTFASC